MSTDVRGRILSTTLDLIGAHGIGGLSNRLVARSAGVSLGTLTYHFPSQDALLSETLRTFVEDEVDRLAAIAAELEGTRLTLAEALAMTRDAIEEQVGRRAQVAQLELYVHATRNEDLRAAAARCFAAYDRVGTAALKATGIADADRFAPVLVGLIDGLELRRLAAADLSIDLTDAVAALISGLASGSPAGSGD